MLTDETKVVYYDFTYTAHDGTRITSTELYDYERGDLTVEEIIPMATARDRDAQVSTFAEFLAHERELILAREVYEVTKKEWWEMFEVLPPLKWCDRSSKAGTVEEFCMSEFWSGPYTDQYARVTTDKGTKYYGALVDYYDESTWIHNRL